MSAVMRHLVEDVPTTPTDVSGVLCVRAGECKAGSAYLPGQTRHGWTVHAAKVTCPRCLEWVHA